MTDREGQPSAGPQPAIELWMGILRPELVLDVPATHDSLPLVRQALRSIGETVQAEPEALEDAELAVTEACANAVEHAYEEGGGDVQVTMSPGESVLEVGVADHGIGIQDMQDPEDGSRGFGLRMIESIASSMEFHPGDGTDLRMSFPMGPARIEAVDGAVPGVEPAERILRRLVAVVAAQRDMSSERVVEALLLAEMVARNALRYLSGETAQIRIEHAGPGFTLTIGPLEPGGADGAVADSDVPVVGPVVARLADDVSVDTTDAGEFLTLRMNPR